jgi:hypothetical protein
MCVRPHASQFRVLKKFIVLTHPTLARQDAPHPGKAAGESNPEAYPFSPTRPRSAKTARFPSGYVEDFDKPRTTLRSFSSTLL